MKILGITQARFSSSRFPGKVLQKLGAETVLGLHLSRLKRSLRVSQWVVATTEEPESKKIVEIANGHDVEAVRGSLEDVLDRFYQTAMLFKPDVVVRVTSDCPLIDPGYLDDLIKQFFEMKVDYAANCLNPTLPDGMDAEVFTFAALETAWKEAKKASDREHVTPYIRDSGKFTVKSIEYPVNWGKCRLTLDNPEDLEVLSLLVERCGDQAELQDYVTFLEKNPEVCEMNSHLKRNEGYRRSLEGDSVC